MNFKNIHIGTLIERKVAEKEIETSLISKFLCCAEDQISEMYQTA